MYNELYVPNLIFEAIGLHVSDKTYRSLIGLRESTNIRKHLVTGIDAPFVAILSTITTLTSQSSGTQKSIIPLCGGYVRTASARRFSCIMLVMPLVAHRSMDCTCESLLRPQIP